MKLLGELRCLAELRKRADNERALREADAVVYDALASQELLALAPPDAQRIDVGRRRCVCVRNLLGG